MDPAFRPCRPEGVGTAPASAWRPPHELLQLCPGELAPGAGFVDAGTGDDERAVYVLHGSGEARLDGRRLALEAGQVLQVPPGVRLGLRNLRADQPLSFLTALPPAGRPRASHAFSPLANRLAWLLRRVARRLLR